MSTKTTLKRIALVAVSALGIGVLSIVPTSAAVTHTAGATLSTSSITVVAGSTASSADAARFYVDLTDDEGTLSSLQTGESISVTVMSDPTTDTNTSDLLIRAITQDTAGTTPDGSFDAITGAPAATAGSYQVPSGSAAASAFVSGNLSYSATAALDNESNRYWFSIYPNANAAIDAGAYTVRVRVHNADPAGRALIDNTLTIRFVSTISEAGARITLAVTGDLYDGEALKFETNRQIRATLDNGTTGGRVVLGVTDTSSSTVAPALNAQIITSAGVSDETLTSVDDTGAANVDHVPSTTALVAARQLVYEKGNGVYGVNDSSIASDVSSTKSVRVRVTDSSASATAAIVIRDTSSAIDNLTDLTLSATGILASEALIKNNVATTTAYTLPLTATTATLTINVDGSSTANLENQAITTKVTWTGAYDSTKVTPASATSATTFTNASGNTTVTVTNTQPLAGAVATILITGFKFVSGTSSDAVGSGSRTVTLTWAAPAVSTVTVIDPIPSVFVKTGSTTNFSVLVSDQFGTAMASRSVRPSLSSSGANGSTTVTYGAVTTNASGIATWSLTDAKAVNDDTDTVTFTDVESGVASSAFTLTYKTTLPAVSTLSGFFSDDFDAAGSATTASIPSTGIVNDAGSRLALTYARNISLDLSANTEADENDMLRIKIRGVTTAGAAARGASVTLTAGDGGHVLNTSGLPSSSRSLAIDADGMALFQVLATKPGLIAFTATSGTATYTFTVNVAVPTETRARTITLTGASTGTANGSGVPMTAQVTDRYGNGVAGVNITASASGVGAFMGGATTQSFTTDSTGTYTFLANSFADAGGAATFSVTMGNAGDSTSAAARFGSSVIDSTVPAGVNSASATVTFAAGRNAAAVAAEAATDAALEAIDAANAATDAANLAAEAADAATVAAEEARDAADAATAAVEALASEVATLIAGLKAQITTLANTVAKIAKKVKA